MTQRTWRIAPLFGALALLALLVFWMQRGDGPSRRAEPASQAEHTDAAPTAPSTKAESAPGIETYTRDALVARTRLLMDADPNLRLQVLAELRAYQNPIIDEVVYGVSTRRRDASEMAGLREAFTADPELALPVLLHRMAYTAPRTRALVLQGLLALLEILDGIAGEHQVLTAIEDLGFHTLGRVVGVLVLHHPKLFSVRRHPDRSNEAVDNVDLVLLE